MVPAPSFFTLASHEVRMESSRSVAVSVMRLPEASHRRLPRIGIVVFRSTTPCVMSSSLSRSNLFTLNSIDGVPPPEGANTTATAKGYCTLFYRMYKDRSSSRRCGNEDNAHIERQGCVCPVHPRECILRIDRIIRRESVRRPLHAKFFPQAPRALHRKGTALCAGFQHGQNPMQSFSIWPDARLVLVAQT